MGNSLYEAIKIRNMIDEDLDFIIGSWIQSYHHDSIESERQNREVFNPVVGDMIWRVYKGGQETRIKKILATATALIACLEADPHEIIGYMVGERWQGALILHYAYTKSVFRRQGIQKALGDAFGFKKGDAVFCSHWNGLTRIKPVMRKWGLIYNPYLAEPRGSIE